MARQSTADNLRDMIVNLGGTPTGRTVAELLDQLETMLNASGASEEQIAEAVAAYLESHIEDFTGGLTSEDMDEIFGD